MAKKKNSLKSELVDILLDEENLMEEETTAVNVNSDKQETKASENKEATNLMFSKDDKSAEATAVIAKPKASVATSVEQNSRAEIKVEQAQALQLAQDRINELETLNAKLEFELSELRSSGEVLYTNNQELKADIDKLKQKVSNLIETHKSEKQFLEDKIYNKDKSLDKYKMKVESLELQLKVDFQKIRSKERELENRIEIMKKENQAVMRSKDDLILDLKRNLDELSLEIESYKDKGRDLHLSNEQAKEKMRKSVKAIRLALNLLETEEDVESIENDEKESA